MAAPATRCLVAALLLLATLVSSAPAGAFMRRIDPGERVELEADEGLLVVAVDASEPLESLRVRRRGGLLDSARVKRIAVGRTAALYRVRAGEYRWDEVRTAPLGLAYDLQDDREFHFVVRPGVVNYAGDLLVRPSGLFRAYFHVANRSLLALDWLDAEHAAATRGLAFAYSGHYPDPFVAFYRRERGTAPLPARTSLPPPAAPALTIPIAELWQVPKRWLVSLSPDGALLAQAVPSGDQWHVDLYDLGANQVMRLMQLPRAVQALQWAGTGTLLVSSGDGDWLQSLNIVRIEGDGAQRSFRNLYMPRPGSVVGLLPDDPGHILFQCNDDKGRLVVQRVDVSSEKALRRFRVAGRERLNRGVENDLAWFADGRGELRAAITAKDDEAVLHYGRDGRFEPVLTLSKDSGFRPVAITPDATEIWGLSDEGRAQRDVLVFDPVQKRIVRTAFSKPGVDVQKLLYDESGAPYGVAYFHEGRLVSEFFGDDERRLNARLERAFPGRSVSVIDRDAAGRHYVLGVEGSDRPYALYHLDLERSETSVLDESLPVVAARTLAAARVVRATGTDGVAIEAYLTLPPGGERPPLVVLSHGGPIGVRDSLRFDPEVQFIASLGYAVLQVNFRGSEGYGRAFRESGRGSFGTLIEDDVHAALQATLATQLVDRERICAVGTSYGGYSSLVAAVRWPQLIDCVVSIAGVTDQVLFFTASDGGRSAAGRKALEKAVGDPHKDLDAMLRGSPLYRYRDLAAPVMLVHGNEDIRVDPEHLRRLQRMLALAGRPPVVLTFADEAHGIVAPANQERAWGAIAGFLRQHLGTPAGAATKLDTGG